MGQLTHDHALAAGIAVGRHGAKAVENSLVCFDPGAELTFLKTVMKVGRTKKAACRKAKTKTSPLRPEGCLEPLTTRLG